MLEHHFGIELFKKNNSAYCYLYCAHAWTCRLHFAPQIKILFFNQVTIINRKSWLLPIFYSSMSIFRINQRFVNGMLYMHKISSHNSFDSFQHLFEWSCILTYSFGNRQWFTTFIASFQNVKYLIKQCIKDLMYFWNNILRKNQIAQYHQRS